MCDIYIYIYIYMYIERERDRYRDRPREMERRRRRRRSMNRRWYGLLWKLGGKNMLPHSSLLVEKQVYVMFAPREGLAEFHLW